MPNRVVIYVAAALFNGRETCFNAHLAEGLEKLNYRTILPQRDGFEFAHLTKLASKLPEGERESALRNIIYYLDMGVFVPKSDIVVANLDEPIDEGVVTEISHARHLDKLVIGIRTDTRTPFGTIQEPMRGMHYFPTYQCNEFIYHQMSCKTPHEAETQMHSLVNKVDEAIKRRKIERGKSSTYLMSNQANAIMRGADTLFRGVEHLHSEKSMEEIVQRYMKNKKIIDHFGPVFS